MLSSIDDRSEDVSDEKLNEYSSSFFSVEVEFEDLESLLFSKSSSYKFYSESAFMFIYAILLYSGLLFLDKNLYF